MQATKAPQPSRFAHIVLRSSDMARLKQWYCDVLGMEVIVENSMACFATFDDEHHRFAFIQMTGGADIGSRGSSPFAHVAIAYADLADLACQYSRMKAMGFAPVKFVNHGPTVSLYYDDPDGNGVELFVDRFPTLQECKDFMRSEVFRKNPVGYSIEPEVIFGQLDAGVPAEEVMAYDLEASDQVARERAARLAEGNQG